MKTLIARLRNTHKIETSQSGSNDHQAKQMQQSDQGVMEPPTTFKWNPYQLQQGNTRRAVVLDPPEDVVRKRKKRDKVHSSFFRTLRNTNSKLASENSRLAKENSSLTNKLSNLAKENSRLVKENSSLTNKLSSLTKANSKLTNQADKKVIKADKFAESIKDTYYTLKKELVDVNGKFTSNAMASLLTRRGIETPRGSKKGWTSAAVVRLEKRLKEISN